VNLTPQEEERLVRSEGDPDEEIDEIKRERGRKEV
jgi:hypothetical protein